MNQEIYDATLQHYLREVISKLPKNQQLQLKSLALCGKRVIIPQHGEAGVFVLSNGERAALFGNVTCKNPFACPVCSARMMSKYSSEIAVGLDEFKKRGLFGFMVTFTIPHLNYMSCREVTDILYNTYSYFRRTMKQKYKRKHKGSVSGQFYNAIKVHHSVTVCEYTHGKNGWHPHFHAIWWIDAKQKDDVLAWEADLNEFWMATAKREMKKYWIKNKIRGNDEIVMQKTVDNLFREGELEGGLFISKSNGVISESLSSDYISGWGANREVTGNYRKAASHEGHRTPYQILEDAYNGDVDSERLYIEFLLQVTRKPVHHRVIWSRTGAKAIIKTALQVIKMSEICKKKDAGENWHVLCWFTRESWFTVLEYDRVFPCISNILYLARSSPNLLYEYLTGLGIFYYSYDSNFLCQHIEDIFNAA